MPKAKYTTRVLIVDDNQDGADALGLLVEELGSTVHVTYGGLQALAVATAFRPDLVLVDLLMPDMDGCNLVKRVRQLPAFANTKIVAITGLKDEKVKTRAAQAGCDSILTKPVTLTEIKSLLAGIAGSEVDAFPRVVRGRANDGNERRLPIDEARRIRSERKSRKLTIAECEAAICDGVIRFQEEFLGWRSDQICILIIKDLLLIRIRNALTVAERQLVKSAATGRDLIKQTRKQLLELARPMLESLVHEATGVKSISMHHDLSTETGEEVVIFSFPEVPRLSEAPGAGE